MLITEITSYRLFEATIRRHTAHDTITVKAAIYAESATHAKRLLTPIHIDGSVLSFNITESNLKSQRGTQTLTADQLKLKSVADQKTLISKNQERERARQKMVKAQQAVQKANAARLSVGR